VFTCPNALQLYASEHLFVKRRRERRKRVKKEERKRKRVEYCESANLYKYRLLNSSVVKFMSGDVHLSERALQQYADVHRLLLEMVAQYPVIQQVFVHILLIYGFLNFKFKLKYPNYKFSCMINTVRCVVRVVLRVVHLFTHSFMMNVNCVRGLCVRVVGACCVCMCALRCMRCVVQNGWFYLLLVIGRSPLLWSRVAIAKNWKT
jgi:hypothetical protein